ncbi:MAG: thiol peroxidase [Lachnospiraceae bacterium]|nr:thiol peroxidase [Lachnospiraceae bacterium]
MNAKNVETIYFQGAPCHTCGLVPKAGDKAPAFTLISTDLKPIDAGCFAGKRIALNVFPSLDTPVCSASVRRFNQEAAGMKNTAVVCVSMDLPFAAARFCSANDIKNVTFGSAFRDPKFGADYGLTMVDGPLAGLLARAVIIIDEDGRVKYSELVEEITNEPDYDAALSALK